MNILNQNAAHCHTSPAIEIAVDAGVRSIEHGSFFTDETAQRMAKRGVFLVPTQQALEMLATHPERFELAPEKLSDLRSIANAAKESVRTARASGVALGSVSDVIGPYQGRRGEEVVLKAALIGAHEAILSATCTNAELFGLGDRIGTVEEGKDADLILVEGEPLDHVRLLADPGAIPLVLRRGLVTKDLQERRHRYHSHATRSPTPAELTFEPRGA